MIRCLAACTAVRPNSAKSTGISIMSPTWNSASSERASSTLTSRLGSVTSSTTVLSSTMRMSPRSSLISTSACTFGPCFLASAAWMPSSSSPWSSDRSSCFEFVSSRIAFRISAEPIMYGHPLSFPVKHQSCFANLVERGAVNHALVIAHHGYRSASIIFEPDYFSFDHSTDRGARQSRATPGESLPVSGRLEWALDTRRRDLQNVLALEHGARVEARLDG